MPVSDPTSAVPPLSADQRKAAAALLRSQTPAVAELGELFARAGHELALVGGSGARRVPRRPPSGRPRPDHRRGARAGARDRRRLGRQDVDGGDRVRHDRPAQAATTIFEITTYRSESYEPRSRKPDVKYGTSLVEDLVRRDFTINAMAARLPSYELVDPFGGLAALQEKVIRTPGRPEDSFSDDPLRILRAARFAARLGFTVGRRRAGGDARAGVAAVDRVRGADHRRADQADADRDARRTASTCWCAPRGRPGAA